MNYSNMTTAALHPSTASISLPPISSIEFQSQIAHHRSSPEVVQPLPPPPPAAPRVLPPLPYPSYGPRPSMVPPPPPPPPPISHGYIDTRPLYPGIPSSYQPMPGRMPLPSSADPSLIVHPPRHKAKEVKRRTKTGCLTCRKRRIKCDEGRPECRNCMKSKRHCQGYDPVFQSQGPHALHPAPPSSNSANPSTTSTVNSQPQRYTSSPSITGPNSTIVPSTPHNHTEYPYPRPPEQVLPHLNQPYHMEGNPHSGVPSYSHPQSGRLQ